MFGAIWSLLTSTFVWGFAAGIIIGWNFLQQPEFIRRWVGGASKDVSAKVDDLKKD